MWAVVTGFVLVGAGCAMSPVVRTFRGNLPTSEIAVVTNPRDIRIASVDEKRVSKDLRFGRGRSVTRIELEPGTHRIVVAKTIPKSALTGTTYNAVNPFLVQETKLWLDAAAGATYVLEEEVQTVPKYVWTARIVEAGTGRVVAPKPVPPETNAPPAMPQAPIAPP